MAPATQSMTGYDEGPTLQRFCASKSAEKLAGDGPGDGEIKVRSCYTGSSVMSSKMCKRRHLRKFQTMISSSHLH